MQPWELKAHRLIARMARTEYERANRLRNGRLRAAHVPYSLPDAAHELVECLAARDEERAKSIFLVNYDAMNA